MLKSIFTLFVILSAPLAYSEDLPASFEVLDEDLSYQFTENSAPTSEKPARSCTTGPQQFASIEELCTALKDESFNKGCALAEREAKFKAVGCQKLPVFELEQQAKPLRPAKPKKQKLPQ